MQVFAIDDDPMFLAMVQALLELQGFEVVTAASASEALAVGPSIRPDAVLLDLSLPDGSGLVLLRQLKALEGWGRIPIIMVTADEHIENLISASQNGACGYLCKPAPFEKVVAMIEAAAANPGRRWIDENGR